MLAAAPMAVSGAHAQDTQETVLKVATAGDMRSFIPAGNTAPATMAPATHVYEGLVTWTSEGEVAPMLAEDLPDVSDDGLTYVFHLRDGVTFHNGTPLTAKTAARSWSYLLDPESAWGCRGYFDGSNHIKINSVEATGDLEVTFSLAEPAGEFLTQMARSDCLEGAIMADAVMDVKGEGDRPIGTGPYMVEEIRPGRDITMVRFPDYKPRSEPTDGYAGKKEAIIDKIVFVVIPDPAAAQAALVSGEVDIWPRIELRYIGELSDTDGIEVSSADTPSIYTLPIQTRGEPLENPKFRQAMNYALDREAMTTALTEGRSKPSSSLIPASSQFYDIAAESSFTYDPNKVKELLEEIGYKGEPVTITTNKNYPIMQETGVLVQGYLQQAGINAQLEVLEFASQLPKYYNGQYDMMTFNYAPTLDPALIIDRITGSKADNPSKVWDNTEAREIVTELVTTPVAERRPLYEKLQALYMADPALLIWSSGEVTDARHDYVKGYESWPGRLPRFWGVSIDK